MTKICGIYMIKNLVNGKVYIGQSIDIRSRWSQHKYLLNNNRYSTRDSHMQNSWNKYGSDSFRFSVIQECLKEEMDAAEKYWIAYYKSTDKLRGYNNQDGGHNYRPCAETRMKQRIAKLGVYDGEKNNNASITEAQAKEIIRLLLEGKNSTEIINMVGGTKRIIVGIRQGRIWKYLTKDITFPHIKTSNRVTACGERCGKSKITNSMAEEIVKELASGQQVSSVSRKLNIDRQIVYRIKAKQTWRFLTKDICFNAKEVS